MTSATEQDRPSRPNSSQRTDTKKIYSESILRPPKRSRTNVIIFGLDPMTSATEQDRLSRPNSSRRKDRHKYNPNRSYDLQNGAGQTEPSRIPHEGRTGNKKTYKKMFYTRNRSYDLQHGAGQTEPSRIP